MALTPTPPDFSLQGDLAQKALGELKGKRSKEQVAVKKAALRQGFTDELIGGSGRPARTDEVMAAALEEIAARTTPEGQEAQQQADQEAVGQARKKILVSAISAAVESTKVFGQSLYGLISNPGDTIKNMAHYMVTHKAEIAAGAVAGGPVRMLVRLLLAGTGGGWVAMAAAGALGGAVAGAVKETIKQPSQLKEGERAVVIAGMKNFYRKAKVVDRNELKKAVIKGALVGTLAGIAGGKFSEWVASQEPVQQATTKALRWLGDQTARLPRPEFNGAAPNGAGTVDNVPAAKGDSVKAIFSNKSKTPLVPEAKAGSTSPATLTDQSAINNPAKPGAKGLLDANEQVASSKNVGVKGATGGAQLSGPTGSPGGVEPAPQVPKTLTLPKGSNPWHEMEGYLKDNLGGREPSGSEVQEAVNKFMAENGIKDPRAVQPGAFKVGQVNQYIQELNGGQPLPAAPEQVTSIQASEVGKYISVRDEIANKALADQNLSNAQVDSASFVKGQQAIQQVMEDQANKIYTSPSSDQAYSEWLTSHRDELVKTGSKAIQEQLQAEHTLAGKVTDVLNQNPGVFQDLPIENTTTTGSFLHLGWNPADAPIEAPLMGANIAANYDMLTHMWAETAKVHPELLPNTHFPVSMSEINYLVDQAKDGDELALMRLRQALHWIRASSKYNPVKFKLITDKQMIENVLKLVPAKGAWKMAA